MYHIHSVEPEDDESEGEQEEQLEPLTDEEFDKLSPEEKLLRAIFGRAPVEQDKRKAKQASPPPPSTRSERVEQSQPERVMMRFGFEQQLLPADLASRVVPTLEAVVRLNRSLTSAFGETQSDEIQIQRIAYGSPMDVELARVSPPTISILHALAQDDSLSTEEQARLKDLYFQMAEAQVEGTRLANQEQVLRNTKLQIEIDGIRMQQLVTLFERLFPQLSEPMRLAIIAQNYPELRLLMPRNIQLLFDADPSSPSGTN